MSRRHNSKVVHTDNVRLVHSGKEYFDTLEAMIDAARHELHFQTYIFLDDDTGRRVLQALLRASTRGVKIYLLLDGYGSSDFPKIVVHQLRNAGIEVRWFGKLFTAF